MQIDRPAQERPAVGSFQAVSHLPEGILGDSFDCRGSSLQVDFSSLVAYGLVVSFRLPLASALVAEGRKRMMQAWAGDLP